MRFRTLDLIRYGHFTGVSLSFPSGGPDFHIVYGENEAGKSTTLSAIGELLFGIPPHSPHNFVHENAALRIGATLEREGKPAIIRRRKGNKDTLLGPDDLPLAAGDGMLVPWLGGVDRTFFCRMFCLDHESLREGGRDIVEAKDDVGATLFAAGAGISGLRGHLAAMEGEAENLWGPRKAGYRKYYQAEERFSDAEKTSRHHLVTATKWQELKSAFEDARDFCDAIEKDIETQVIELGKITRIRRVYRAVRRIAEIDGEIARFGTIAVLPADVARQFEKAAADNGTAEARLNTFREQMEAIVAEVAAIVVDDNLVRHGADIERLYKRRIELAPERAHLPKRRAELEAAESSLKARALELEWAGESADLLVEKIPSRAKVQAVRGLLTSHGGKSAAVTNARKALDEAEEKLNDVRSRIEAVGSPQDVSGLAGVVKSIRALGDLETRNQASERERLDADDLCRRKTEAMSPSVADEATLSAIKVPSAALIRTHRDMVRDLERRIHAQDTAIRNATRTLENNRKSYARLVSDEHIVSAEDLAALRRRRDEGWSIIKRRHIENVAVPETEVQAFTDGGSLPAVYEAAVGGADAGADQRFENAQSTAEAMVLARQITDDDDALTSQKEELDALRGEETRLSAAWAKMWKGVTDTPLAPDEMLTWLEARTEVLGLIAKRDGAARSASALQQQILDAKQQLLGMLEDPAMAAAADTVSLSGILAAAETRIQAQQTTAQKRAELEADERKCKADAERKRKAVATAEDEQAQWKSQWSDALAGLGLSALAAIEAIAEQIEAIEQMREIAAKIRDLRHERIEKIERDLIAFAAEVEKLVASVAAELAGKDADEAVLEIHSRLGVTNQGLATRDQKNQAIEDLREKLDECNASRKDAQAIISGLQQVAGVDTVDALRAAIQQSDALRAFKEEQGRLRTALEADGDGVGVEMLAEECQSCDLDQAAAREETLAQSLKDLRQRQIDAVQRRNEAARLFEAVGGDDIAAKAAADRQVALAEMKEAAAQYVRVRSAAIVLKWAIERFRREKQAPLLKRAGELFAILTGGSFEKLTLEFDDKDRPHLAGARSDGGTVGVSGLSDGSADQLFMALRIAAVEEYLTHAGPAPFVADDLFINYDDTRAAAGLTVLRQLAEKTQVLFFTHHQHLVNVARTAFGGNLSVSVLERRAAPVRNVA